MMYAIIMYNKGFLIGNGLVEYNKSDKIVFAKQFAIRMQL